ncbi:MAG: mycothiol synthase [Acidimicrobiia bacterium]|nr:mycothiol synthase [Acidimicrobiia bacterium]
MSVRPYSWPQDLPGLDELFERCRLRDGHHPLSENKYRTMRGAQSSGEGFVIEESGIPVGYLQLLASKIDGTYEFELAVDPALRGELEEPLLESALARARQLGGDTAMAWVYTPGGERPLQEFGFEPLRDLHQLRVPLPAAAPQMVLDIQIRAFENSDEDALLSLNNRAFAGHPEAGNWTAEDLHERQAHQWYDPTGIRMAFFGERLVGFCWTKEHPGGLGEIYLIAVDPGFRGRGVGRAIALDGLDYLSSAKGSTQGMLYVDAVNESALRLYEGLGFEVHHTDRVFSLSI